ncbi:MAG: hypothetical protein FJX23_10615, partial [Alphaproteobacteria bacterium]|nr:hypothetical protein [Alphaproteobacteria bacterium]
MAVKGYTPPPDPQDFSSKFQLRSAQRAHEKFAKQAEEGRFVAKDKPDYQSASRHRNGEGNPLLQAAAVRRNSIAYGDNSYTNPMDFVRDMWADGFISTEQAVPLVKEFEALGKPGQLMDAFLVQQHRLGHVTGRNRDDKRFILGVTGDRSHHVADELTQMRTYTDVERSPSEEAARTDDNRTD